MEAREGVPVFDPGSPVGTSLSQDIPASLRSRSCLPEPLCRYHCDLSFQRSVTNVL